MITEIRCFCGKNGYTLLLKKTFSRPLSYSLASGGIGKPTFFSPTFSDALCYEAESHETARHHGYSTKQHDISCPHYISSSGYRGRSRSSGGLKSVNSLHSSGQDSGIVDATQCQCGQLSSQSSEESSYEDSLQSVPHRRGMRDSSMRRSNPVLNQNPSHQDRRSRNRSITEAIVRPSGLHRPVSLTHLPQSSAILVSGPPSALRKSTERLMFYPVNQ
ncbi:hypothetical protein HHI36_013045 [Cryptolaemus montrouzieri]|uniref:Uncharacterized protein n=1 Tax=Cryptolaemus montrouzieri TaxID=559131 RepID=A0ABD2NH18_9CUCU